MAIIILIALGPFILPIPTVFLASVLFILWARRYKTVKWLAAVDKGIRYFFAAATILAGMYLLVSHFFDKNYAYHMTGPFADGYTTNFYLTLAWVLAIPIGCYIGWYLACSFFKSWKKTLVIVVSPFLVVLLPYLFLKYIYNPFDEYALWPQVNDCGYYTKALKGGVYRFGDQDYRVTLCGASSSIKDIDNVRLQIHSMEGKLLAERYYEIDLRGQFSIYELEYENDTIWAYVDDGGQAADDAKIVIKMPPTWLDRLRAKFPLNRKEESSR